MIKTRRVFYLNSQKRLAGEDASSCLMEVKIPTHETFTHVCVVDASIPKSYHLIQAGYNTFTVVENAVPRIITLMPACYSATAFATEVKTQLNTGAPAGWVYGMTRPSAAQPSTGKWTYTVTGNATQPSFITTTNVYEQLGFNAMSTYTFSGGTLVSPNVMKMQSEDALYIHSDIVTDGVDDILQEIYTGGVPDMGVIKFTCPDWQMMAKPLSKCQSNSFRFTLTDENARVMNLNGLNYVMTLMVFTLGTWGFPHPPELRSTALPPPAQVPEPITEPDTEPTPESEFTAEDFVPTDPKE